MDVLNIVIPSLAISYILYYYLLNYMQYYLQYNTKYNIFIIWKKVKNKGSRELL